MIDVVILTVGCFLICVLLITNKEEERAGQEKRGIGDKLKLICLCLSFLMKCAKPYQMFTSACTDPCIQIHTERIVQ